MPNLKDIKDGKVKVGTHTSISFNGKVYRGRKAIMELVAVVFPEPIKKKRGTNGRKRRKTTRAKRSTKPVVAEQPERTEPEQPTADEPADTSDSQ